MGTSYPTSRLKVVCRAALPRALAAQSEVSSDVFSSVVVASQGSHAVGPGRSSQLNIPWVCRFRVPDKLDVVRGVGLVRPVSLETPTR